MATTSKLNCCEFCGALNGSKHSVGCPVIMPISVPETVDPSGAKQQTQQVSNNIIRPSSDPNKAPVNHIFAPIPMPVPVPMPIPMPASAQGQQALPPPAPANPAASEYTEGKFTCSRCKGRGYYITDILAGTSRFCDCCQAATKAPF